MSGDWPYYEVIGCGQSFIIADAAGQSVNGRHYRCHHIAHASAHKLENQARLAPLKRSRACLCCGGRFISQGPHNRLCDRCRREG